MHTAAGDHGKIAPHLCIRLEVDALNITRGGLEAVVGVLRRDPRCDHVLGVLGGGLEVVEVDIADRLCVLSVKGAHLRDVVERDAHGHVELRRGEAHAGDPLGHGVLHLQPRLELDKVVILGLGNVQILDGSHRTVANLLAEAHSRAHHLLELVIGSNDRWALLKNLPETALCRAVAASESNHIAVHVADDLHLEVARGHTELDEEDWGAGDLSEHLRVGRAQLCLVECLAETLAATAL